MKFSAILAALVPVALSQSLCGPTDYFQSGNWYLNNNEWNSDAGTGAQCTYVDSINSGGVSWHTDWSYSGSSSSVKAYPYAGRLLPTKKLVSAIGSITNSAEWQYQGSSLRCNVAYDLFTASDPNHPTYYGEYELMVW